MIHPKDIIENNIKLIKASNNGRLVFFNNEAVDLRNIPNETSFEYYSQEAKIKISDDLCDEILSELGKLTLK